MHTQQNAYFVNSHNINPFQQVFCSQNSVLPDNHGSQMGVILQSVKHYQCYTIYLYSYTIVVEYQKRDSMWVDNNVGVLSSN